MRLISRLRTAQTIIAAQAARIRELEQCVADLQAANSGIPTVRREAA